MSEQRRAFDRKKHELTKGMAHLAKEIYISTDDIFENKPKYADHDHWGYVRDQFREKHGVEVTDTEKLVLYTTVLDNTMKIVGHMDYSITRPKE